MMESGDGSDSVEGQENRDTLLFNGSAGIWRRRAVEEAGVQVLRGAGGGMVVRIRGAGAGPLGGDPLYVVDGTTDQRVTSFLYPGGLVAGASFDDKFDKAEGVGLGKGANLQDTCVAHRRTQFQQLRQLLAALSASGGKEDQHGRLSCKIGRQYKPAIGVSVPGEVRHALPDRDGERSVHRLIVNGGRQAQSQQQVQRQRRTHPPVGMRCRRCR